MKKSLLPNFDMSGDIGWGMFHLLFIQTVLDRNFHYIQELDWDKGLRLPKLPGDLMFRHRNDDGTLLILHSLENGILICKNCSPTEHGSSFVMIAARTQSELDAWIKEVRKVIPKVEPEKGKVPVNFWTQGQHSNVVWPRKLEVPKWKEIEGNYPAVTKETVGDLLFRFTPSAGKLILWHGEPGTGKTWALRALLGEWEKWCRSQFIVDPEKLFGTSSQYLLQVLLQEGNDDPAEVFDWEKESSAPPQDRKWRLLILEDTGELLTQDAKERSGQGLSRLLNTTDGLIGQGLNILVLITTNEPLSKLHPAVSRPGRTAAEIEFTTFSTTEAEAWLLAHGIKDAGLSAGNHTLAELYARVAGHKVRRKALQKVGF